MSFLEFRAIFWLCLLGTLITVFYALAKVPLPRIEIGFFALIIGGWAWKRRQASFALWRSELRDVFHMAVFFIMAIAVVYFFARLMFGLPGAFIVAGLLTLYLAAFHHVGMVLILNERYAEVDRFLNTMLSWFPHDSRLHTQKAYAAFLQDDLEQAVESSTRAIEAHVGSKEKAKKASSFSAQTIEAYSIRVSAYICMHDGDSALRDAELFVKTMPLQPMGYFNRGTALLYLDEFIAAQADFSRTLKMPLEPYHRAATENNSGLAAYCLNDYSAALSHYMQALGLTLAPFERRDLFPVIYTNVANLYFSQSNIQKAWEVLHIAHEINPSDRHALLGLAVLHASEAEWDEALAIWHSLASQHPFFADVDQVAERYYRWTSPMADIVRQIAARANA